MELVKMCESISNENSYRMTVRCGSKLKESFGTCQMKNLAERCTLFDCSRRKENNVHNKELLLCPEGGIEFILQFSNYTPDASCTRKIGLVPALAKIILNPVEGKQKFASFIF